MVLSKSLCEMMRACCRNEHQRKLVEKKKMLRYCEELTEATFPLRQAMAQILETKEVNEFMRDFAPYSNLVLGYFPNTLRKLELRKMMNRPKHVVFYLGSEGVGNYKNFLLSDLQGVATLSNRWEFQLIRDTTDGPFYSMPEYKTIYTSTHLTPELLEDAVSRAIAAKLKVPYNTLNQAILKPEHRQIT